MERQDNNCIFCRIVAGRIPARIIAQNDKAIAILDAFPVAEGHALVISKIHVGKIQEMRKEHLMAVFELLQNVTGAIEKAANVDASMIAVHNGKESGQEIPHVHVHVIPRRAADGAGPVHSMFRTRPRLADSEMDLVLARIKKEL